MVNFNLILLFLNVDEFKVHVSFSICTDQFTEKGPNLARSYGC